MDEAGIEFRKLLLRKLTQQVFRNNEIDEPYIAVFIRISVYPNAAAVCKAEIRALNIAFANAYRAVRILFVEVMDVLFRRYRLRKQPFPTQFRHAVGILEHGTYALKGGDGIDILALVHKLDRKIVPRRHGIDVFKIALAVRIAACLDKCGAGSEILSLFIQSHALRKSCGKGVDKVHILL